MMNINYEAIGDAAMNAIEKMQKDSKNNITFNDDPILYTAKAIEAAFRNYEEQKNQ